MSELTRLRGEVGHLTEMLRNARETKLSTLVEDLEVQVGFLSEENAEFALFLEREGYSARDVDEIAQGRSADISYIIDKRDRHINIPINEYDLEKFKDIVNHNRKFQWSFSTEYGEKIWVNFMSEDELEQREK